MKTCSFGGVLLHQFIVVIRHSHKWVFLGTLNTRKQAQGHRHRHRHRHHYCHLSAIRRSHLTRDPDISHRLSDGFSSNIEIMFNESTHPIGHFRIISGLFFKASPGAHLFI